MFYFFIVFKVVLLSLFLASSPSWAAPSTVTMQKEVAFGVLAYRNKAKTIARWQPLVDYLSEKVPSYDFKLVAGNYPELEQKIQSNQLDFLLTQPSHYVALTYRQDLSSPLASMVNKEGKSGYTVFGGVIFTASDRADINDLADLKDKQLVTPSKKSLGAYQMQAFELLHQGIFANKDSMKVMETGLPQVNAIKAVLAGQADAGFVRSGVLEKLISSGELQASQLKILNRQSFKDFSLISSTQLYPEWPVASFTHTDATVVKKVLLALLQIERGEALATHLDISGFTIAEDYRKIDQLLRKLHLPPFDEQEFTLYDIWQRWQAYLIAVMLGVMTLTSLLVIFLYRKNKSLARLTSELKHSHQQIETLDLAMQQSPVRIFMTNTAGEIIYVNKAVVEQSGFDYEEIYRKNPRVFASGDTPKEVFKELWHTISKGEVWNGEVVNLSKQGNKQFMQSTITSITDQDDGYIGYLCIQKDVTAEKQHEQKIHELSFYDSLTGLANRASLESKLNQIIARNALDEGWQTEPPAQASLILINIDRFKVINDANGKRMGNLFLKQFADSLKESLPEHSFVARLTADEFAVLLEMSASEELPQILTQKVEELLLKLKMPFNIDGLSWNVSVSMGVEMIPQREDYTLDDALRHTDTALHYAKSKGGNQYRFFDETIEKAVVDDFKIEQDLKRAIADKQFELHYQPQVNLAGKVISTEALIRWPHPEKGMVSPVKFIPIAEQSDLIIEIGDWVLNEACQKLALSPSKQADYGLSINISPRHFMMPDFEQKVTEVIKHHQIDPQRITLEITEGLFLNNIKKVLPIMKRLTDKGIKFSIDDFGTGFSSLGYIKDLPIHELKIDRMFVKNIAEDPDDAMLVEAILSIAEHMHFDVVVEGVETTEQEHFFKRFADIRLQGYKYGKPCSYNSFVKAYL